MRALSFITDRKNKTSTNLKPKQQSEMKETKENHVYNYRKISNLNADINIILRNINLSFDFKDFVKSKLQPLEKVSLKFHFKSFINIIAFFPIKKISM